MFRFRVFLVVVSVLTAAALPALTSARTSKPLIKGEEVGYFGNANLAYTLSVFVYSNSQPRGTRVTVCVKGVCKRAHGNRGRTAWYSASFNTKVTQGLLCMHNNGSTPQRS